MQLPTSTTRNPCVQGVTNLDTGCTKKAKYDEDAEKNIVLKKTEKHTAYGDREGSLQGGAQYNA